MELFSKSPGGTQTVPKSEIGREQSEKSEPLPANAPAEKILDEERRKLDDILKRRR